MQRFPMTTRGAKLLQEELQHLKFTERPTIVKEIAAARAHGDLSENAEYHAARERQGFIEARIKDIEAKLSLAQIIDITKIHSQGRVVFGATVILRGLSPDGDCPQEITYQIVGEDEADVKENKLSINSPLARALIGKEEGEEIAVQTPNGEIHYEIIEIQHI